MTNDSSTGGYLAPEGAPFLPPLEDQALQAFFESWVASITGIDPDLISPRWLPTPAQQPDISTNWIAIGVGEEDADWNAAVVHVPTASGGKANLIQRHARFELLCTFYGPSASNYASLLREGIAVSQNREPLQLAGMGWVKTGNIINMSGLINGQYYRRLDMNVTLVRNITRVYPVLDLVSSSGKVHENNGTSVNWSTANVKGNEDGAGS